MNEPRVIVLTRERDGRGRWRFRAAGYPDLETAGILAGAVVMGKPAPTRAGALRSLAFALLEHEHRGEFGSEK